MVKEGLSLKKRKESQAMLELAIMGSLFLSLLTVLISYGVRFSSQQKVMMDSFRDAAREASTDRVAANFLSYSGQYIEDITIPDPSSPYGVPHLSSVSSGSGATRSYFMETAQAPDPASLARTHINVGGSEVAHPDSIVERAVTVEDLEKASSYHRWRASGIFSSLAVMRYLDACSCWDDSPSAEWVGSVTSRFDRELVDEDGIPPWQNLFAGTGLLAGVNEGNEDSFREEMYEIMSKAKDGPLTSERGFTTEGLGQVSRRTPEEKCGPMDNFYNAMVSQGFSNDSVNGGFGDRGYTYALQNDGEPGLSALWRCMSHNFYGIGGMGSGYRHISGNQDREFKFIELDEEDAVNSQGIAFALPRPEDMRFQINYVRFIRRPQIFLPVFLRHCIEFELSLEDGLAEAIYDYLLERSFAAIIRQIPDPLGVLEPEGVYWTWVAIESTITRDEDDEYGLASVEKIKDAVRVRNLGTNFRAISEAASLEDYPEIDTSEEGPLFEGVRDQPVVSQGVTLHPSCLVGIRGTELSPDHPVTFISFRNWEEMHVTSSAWGDIDRSDTDDPEVGVTARRRPRQGLQMGDKRETRLEAKIKNLKEANQYQTETVLDYYTNINREIVLNCGTIMEITSYLDIDDEGRYFFESVYE